MNKLIQRIRNLESLRGPNGKREINIKSDHASRIILKQTEYENILLRKRTNTKLVHVHSLNPLIDRKVRCLRT